MKATSATRTRGGTFMKMISRFWMGIAMSLVISGCSNGAGLQPVHMEDKPLAKPLPINTRPRILAIGQGFSVGVKQDGTVWTWGSNFQGILARPISKPGDGYDPYPGQVPGMEGAVSVAASSSHILVLMKDGTVWSWGENNHRQLGYDTPKPYSSTPQQIPGLTDVVDIAAQWGVSQVLKKDGSVWGFGWGIGGGLGKSALAGDNKLLQIEGLENIVRIEIGRGVSLAIDNKGRLWTYGDDKQSLGRTLKPEQSAAIPAIGKLPKRVVDMSANAHAIYALLEDGTVWSWGYNNAGQLGTGERNEKGHPLPARIPSLSSIVLIASGMGGAAVAHDGTIVTWGTSAGGGPRNMTTWNLWTPHALKEKLSSPAVYLVGGEAYALVDKNGNAWFWQGNARGVRGTGITVDEPSAEYWTTPEKSRWTHN